jgi:hypothetical protein
MCEKCEAGEVSTHTGNTRCVTKEGFYHKEGKSRESGEKATECATITSTKRAGEGKAVTGGIVCMGNELLPVPAKGWWGTPDSMKNDFDNMPLVLQLLCVCVRMVPLNCPL